MCVMVKNRPCHLGLSPFVVLSGLLTPGLNLNVKEGVEYFAHRKLSVDKCHDLYGCADTAAVIFLAADFLTEDEAWALLFDVHERLELFA